MIFFVEHSDCMHVLTVYHIHQNKNKKQKLCAKRWKHFPPIDVGDLEDTVDEEFLPTIAAYCTQLISCKLTAGIRSFHLEGLAEIIRKLSQITISCSCLILLTVMKI